MNLISSKMKYKFFVYCLSHKTFQSEFIFIPLPPPTKKIVIMLKLFFKLFNNNI